MRACHNCLHWDVCSVREDDIACGIYKPKEKRNVKPQTNADRIRAMSDEELAGLIRVIYMSEECPLVTLECETCFFKEVCAGAYFGKEIEWLQKPAEGE